jgi:hypothetical protein
VQIFLVVSTGIKTFLPAVLNGPKAFHCGVDDSECAHSSLANCFDRLGWAQSISLQILQIDLNGPTALRCKCC